MLKRAAAAISASARLGYWQDRQQAASIAENLKQRLLEAPHALQKRHVHGLVSEIIVDREMAVISGPRDVAAAVSAPDRLGEFSVLYVNEWRTGKVETANWRVIVQRPAYKGETIGCNKVAGCSP